MPWCKKPLTHLRLSNSAKSGRVDLRGANLDHIPAAVLKKHRTTALLLGHNSLTELDAVDFTPLVLLSCVYLNHNALTSFPLSVFTVRRLKKLYLNDNNLVYLPVEVELLEHLQVLAVSGNNLLALPPLGGLINLQALYASRNELMALPESIGFCTELSILSLEGNRLEQLPFRALLRLSQLHNIHLGNNPVLASHLPDNLHGDPNMTLLRRFLRSAVRGRIQSPGDSSTDMWVFKKVSSLIVRARSSVRPGSAMSLYTDVSGDFSDTMSVSTAVGRKRTLAELRHSIRKNRHGRNSTAGSSGDVSPSSSLQGSSLPHPSSLPLLDRRQSVMSMSEREASASRRGSVVSIDSITQLMRMNYVVESHQYEMMEDMRRLMDNAMRENEKLAARVQDQLALLAAERKSRNQAHQALVDKLQSIERHGIALQRGLDTLTSNQLAPDAPTNSFAKSSAGSSSRTSSSRRNGPLSSALKSRSSHSYVVNADNILSPPRRPTPPSTLPPIDPSTTVSPSRSTMVRFASQVDILNDS